MKFAVIAALFATLTGFTAAAPAPAPAPTPSATETILVTEFRAVCHNGGNCRFSFDLADPTTKKPVSCKKNVPSLAGMFPLSTDGTCEQSELTWNAKKDTAAGTLTLTVKEGKAATFVHTIPKADLAGDGQGTSATEERYAGDRTFELKPSKAQRKRR